MDFNNIMTKYRLALGLICYTCIIGDVFGEALTPPRYVMTDKFGINVASSRVTTSLETVSIGGAYGLQHSFASYTDQFLPKVGESYVGVNDIFSAYARYELIGEDISYRETFYELLYFMRLFSPEGSEDFEILRNGRFDPDVRAYEERCKAANSCSASAYSYKAIRDPQNTLRAEGAYLVWTKPDGTKLRYFRGGDEIPSGDAFLQEIVKPDGHSTFIHRKANHSAVLSVTTNTGFQLKYVYVPDYSRVTEDSKLPRINNAPADTATWSRLNPKYIMGINNSIEYCDVAKNTIDCGSIESWPRATFIWPSGMPRAFYAANSMLKVVDSKGGTSEYHTSPRDTLPEFGDELYYIPTLVGVKTSSSRTVDFRFTYKTRPGICSIAAGPCTMDLNEQRIIVDRAAGKLGQQEYRQINQTQPPLTIMNAADIKAYIRRDLLGAVVRVENLDGVFEADVTIENKLRKRIPNDGPTETFHYDNRGNITRIDYNDGATFVEAEYAPTCTESTQKVCNKATWISDEKGNRTHYTYHAPSGQVASVTSPPDNNGIKAQTRFEYEQKYARVKNASGTLVQAASPIWLKTQESYCIDSNYVNGSCAANDEVVTRYEYQHNNLLLTGMTVTADSKTLRTCYQYDIYGNRIGETQPKANLSSCDQ